MLACRAVIPTFAATWAATSDLKGSMFVGFSNFGELCRIYSILIAHSQRNSCGTVAERAKEDFWSSASDTTFGGFRIGMLRRVRPLKPTLRGSQKGEHVVELCSSSSELTNEEWFCRAR
jgi:hypothetical protein